MAQKQTHRSWNRIENPEMDTQLYGQLIFDKSGKNIQWKKDSLFNKWYWKIWNSVMQKTETGARSYTIHKINSKWITSLNVRPETIKLLEENIGSNSLTLLLTNFFGSYSKSNGNKSKNKQMRLH